MGVAELRSEVLELCDILQAILAFNYQYPIESQEVLDGIRADVPIAPARRLRQDRDNLRGQVRDVVRKFGFKENPRKFAKMFKEVSRSELGTMLLPKFVIDTMFTNYTDKWIDWGSFPPHVLVYLDFTGKSHRPKQFDWKLPEASLYEDMCIAYNQALDCRKVASASTVPIRESKVMDFAVRSAVLCAFYFVESYLNGVAFDFFIRNSKRISEQEAEALLEWDHRTSREKWLNFKEKIHRYPRIILGLPHPPLTEANSAEMKLLITKAKDVRDAIVHQSPKGDVMTGEPGAKLTNFLHLRLNDATEIVDAAIALVRKLNALLGKEGIMLDWLKDRDSTGRFPEAAFV